MKIEEEIIKHNPRMLGKSYQGFVMFVQQSEMGKPAIYATPKTKIYSQKYVDQLIQEARREAIKQLIDTELEVTPKLIEDEGTRIIVEGYVQILKDWLKVKYLNN